MNTDPDYEGNGTVLESQCRHRPVEAVQSKTKEIFIEVDTYSRELELRMIFVKAPEQQKLIEAEMADKKN